MTTNNVKPEGRKSRWTAILQAWLIVGSLDMSAAIIQTLIYGRNPIDMFRYIASGFFGNTALEGGTLYAVLGVLFHYCIALIWSMFFFFIYPRISFLSINKILTGILYGFFVWFVMNQLILPLSNTPPFPFKLKSALIAMSILIVAIGFPLAFLASRFFSKKDC
ncbi:MAG: hypothetical protein JSS93_13710 [Bacteroidetes bacterium]|nr:hypothetical protein [Bacteroidota bacterium]